MTVNFNAQNNSPAFGSRIKVITKGKDKCHIGVIKMFGLEDDFKKGVKTLSKEARKKKLDIFIGGFDENPWQHKMVKIMTGKDKKVLESVDLLDLDFSTTKQAMSHVFDTIKQYIEKA